MTQITSDNNIMEWSRYVLSAIGGVLLTLVSIRTKLALMDRRIESRKVEIAQEAKDRRDELASLERRFMERLARIEKMQRLILQVMADVAKKVGVDARFSDVVIQYLAEDTREGRVD